MSDSEDLLPDSVHRYAERPDATLDVFVPEDDEVTPTRAVFLIHGGFWRQAYDATTVRPLARALTREGYVVVAPEYRRVGGDPDGGGGWPVTCEDVEAAYAAMPRLLNTLGIRPTEVVLTGHSAGGHLALYLAACGVVAERVVPLAPVADLRDALETRMGDGAAVDFLGGEDPVDAADPARLLDSQRPGGPVTILHGTADEPVPVANSRKLVERHPWIELRELDGVDHMSMIDPDSSVFTDVLTAFGP